MSYANLHTEVARDIALAGVSAEAFRLYIQGFCYAQVSLKDGFIAAPVLPTIGIPTPKLEWVEELVRIGKWEIVPGGWLIHDYLQWNWSAAQRAEKTAFAAQRKAESRARERARKNAGLIVQTERMPARIGEGSNVARYEPEHRDHEPPFPIEEPGRPATTNVTGLEHARTTAPIPQRPSPAPGNTEKGWPGSPERPLPNPTMRGHRGPLGKPVMDYARLQSKNGFVGKRFLVPIDFHQDLVRRYGGDEAAAADALAGFYKRLDDSLGENDSIPSIYPFINGHFVKFVESRAAAVPAAGGPARRADDQRAPVDASMREQLSQAANRKT